MATVLQGLSPDLISMYSGFSQNQQEVGAGLIAPNIYATPDYAERKIRSIPIGGVSDIIYSAADYDPTPTVLVIAFEPAYQTIIGLNLRYVPQRDRQAILKFVIDSNRARILSNQPMLIDWASLSRAVPRVKYITRRYKIVLVGLRKTYPLVEWPNVVKESSPYESHWREGQS